MTTNRMYSREQVLLIVEEVLRRLDSIDEPAARRANLDNDIPQNTSPEDAKLTVTVAEASRLIGISKPKMYELVRSGQMRSIKVGKKILITRQALAGWLKRGDSYDKKAR